jgi:hypothetical protein
VEIERILEWEMERILECGFNKNNTKKFFELFKVYFLKQKKAEKYNIKIKKIYIYIYGNTYL